MKNLISVLFILVGISAFSQTAKNVTDLTTQVNVIRNESVSGANTKGRIADMYVSTFLSSPNIFESYNDPSWITGLAWSKISSTPTTISGYGITDFNSLGDARWASISGAISGSGTANEIAYFSGTSTLGSLTTATYPSLTELSYAKGVTSAIQTQINTKQATITFGTNVQASFANNIGSAGAPVLFNGAAGTPSSIGLANGTGLPPLTGISGWPANASGALSNNGAGVLSWSLTVPTSLSSLYAASQAQLFDNGDWQQEWKWGTLAAGSGLILSSVSTAATGNTYKLFEIDNTGANVNPSQTTYGAYFRNRKTGSGTNVALLASATGGATNIGLDLVGQMRVGGSIGTANQLLGMNNAASGLEYKTVSTSTTAVSSDVGVTLSGANAIVINIPDAAAAVRGVVTTGSQTFGGNKTFTGTTAVAGFTASSSGSFGGALTVSTTALNGFIVTGNWTANSNGQKKVILLGQATARGTASDEIYGASFEPSFIASAASQIMSVVRSSGAYTNTLVSQSSSAYTFDANSSLSTTGQTGSPTMASYVSRPGISATITGTYTQYDFWAKDTSPSVTATLFKRYGIVIESTAALNGFGTNAPTSTLHVVGTTRLDGNVTLPTAGNKILLKEGSGGFMGQVALTAGTNAVTVSGVTTSTRCFPALVTPSGASLTVNYQCVCTANTVTLQANLAATTINTSDTSTLNYILFEPAP